MIQNVSGKKTVMRDSSYWSHTNTSEGERIFMDSYKRYVQINFDFTTVIFVFPPENKEPIWRNTSDNPPQVFSLKGWSLASGKQLCCHLVGAAQSKSRQLFYLSAFYGLWNSFADSIASEVFLAQRVISSSYDNWITDNKLWLELFDLSAIRSHQGRGRVTLKESNPLMLVSRLWQIHLCLVRTN